MSRAPETGYYFEPINERLVVVMSGASFPTDDHWAWIGDTIEMTGEQAKLTVALRWPGIDPDDLYIEFDLDFEKAAQDEERRRLEEEAGQLAREPSEIPFDLNKLLDEAEELKAKAAAVAFKPPAEEQALESTPEVAVAKPEAGMMRAEVAPGTKVVRVPRRRPRVRKPE